MQRYSRDGQRTKPARSLELERNDLVAVFFGKRVSYLVVLFRADVFELDHEPCLAHGLKEAEGDFLDRHRVGVAIVP